MTPAHQANTTRRKANVRLGWALASTALVFALGFVVKVWLSH